VQLPKLSPVASAATATLIYNVAANSMSDWLSENASKPVADFVAWPGSTVVVLVVVFGVMLLIQRRSRNAPPIAPRTDEGMAGLLSDAVRERDRARQERDDLRAELQGMREAEAEREAQLLVQKQQHAAALVSRWLPDPSDFTTFTMSVQDLNEAYERGLELARETLAPDSRLWFDSLRLGNLPTVVFVADSRLADKNMTVHVGDDFSTHTQVVRGSLPTATAHRQEAPWRTDASFVDLVHRVGYRLRPHGDYAEVSYVDAKDKGESRWRICVDAEDFRYPCYALISGDVVEVKR
jgi:hypothetical protein